QGAGGRLHQNPWGWRRAAHDCCAAVSSVSHLLTRAVLCHCPNDDPRIKTKENNQMSNLALSAVETHPEIETKEGHYKIPCTTVVVSTDERIQLKSLTREIAAFVEQAPIRDGIVHVSSLHTTAGLMMNEVQGALLSDVTNMFEQVIPSAVYYKHNDPLLSDC